MRSLAETDKRISCFFHDMRLGKGAAIRTAIGKINGDIAIIQDADLEYNPNDIVRLITPILEGNADVVYGSRFASSEYRRILYFWHAIGNKFLTFMCNLLNDVNLTDMEVGYKCFRSDILKQIPLKSNGFDIEPEITAKTAKWGVRFYEVPISYSGRSYAEGKKITVWDGFKAIWAIFWFRFGDNKFTTHEGFYILAAVRNARKFNEWMYRVISKYIGKRVFEAGCGIGNLTELLLDSKLLIASDFDPFYVEMIGRRFGHLDGFRSIQMDLTNAADYQQLNKDMLDTIICLNVLEHIAPDEVVLGEFVKTLVPGGHAIILVPQHPWLYAPVDKTLGHERRYTQDELIKKMKTAGFEIVHHQGFNRLGTLGWFVSGKIFKNKDLSPFQMKMYNRLLPLAKLIEHIRIWPSLSLIVVGRKPFSENDHRPDASQPAQSR